MSPLYAAEPIDPAPLRLYLIEAVVDVEHLSSALDADGAIDRFRGWLALTMPGATIRQIQASELDVAVTPPHHRHPRSTP